MKITQTILILGIMLTLPACDSKDNPSEASNKTTSAQSRDTGPGTPMNANSFTEKDLVFVLNKAEYPLHSDAGKLLAVLGKPDSQSEAESCAYVGMDRQFVYKAGIEIDTYPIKDKDMIDSIVLTGKDFATAKGITIGSSKTEVEAAYGTTYKDEGEVITYYQNNDFENLKAYQLYFVFEDGVVEIGYYGAANANASRIKGHGI
ncbi:MAG: hypothetical protein ACYS80_19120 [Planctomycetota bacterium]